MFEERDVKSHELHVMLDRFVSHLLQLLSTDAYTKYTLLLIRDQPNDRIDRILQLTLEGHDW